MFEILLTIVCIAGFGTALNYLWLKRNYHVSEKKPIYANNKVVFLQCTAVPVSLLQILSIIPPKVEPERISILSEIQAQYAVILMETVFHSKYFVIAFVNQPFSVLTYFSIDVYSS